MTLRPTFVWLAGWPVVSSLFWDSCCLKPLFFGTIVGLSQIHSFWIFGLPSLKLTSRLWGSLNKWWFPRFSGVMLVSGRVNKQFWGSDVTSPPFCSAFSDGEPFKKPSLRLVGRQRLLFLPFVHGVFSGICIGIGLTILKSLCARGPYGILVALSGGWFSLPVNWRLLGIHLEDHLTTAAPIYKPWKGHVEGVPQPDP